MPNTKQPTIKEQLEALKPKQDNLADKDAFDMLNSATKLHYAKETPTLVNGNKIDLLINSEKSKKGGKQPGAGRPPKEETLVMRGIREYMAQHANEEIDITVTDPKTGKSRVVKKPRSIILLEILFNEAFKKNNVAAIKEWLDRAVGKPAQPIRGDGDSDAPIRMEHDISSIIAKAYGDDADNGED